MIHRMPTRRVPAPRIVEIVSEQQPANDAMPRFCDRCELAWGGTDCQCSRDYTRELVLFAWRSICAGIRSLDFGDWLAIASVVVAICAVVFK